MTVTVGGSSQAIGHTYTNPWYDRNICVSALERALLLGHIRSYISIMVLLSVIDNNDFSRFLRQGPRKAGGLMVAAGIFINTAPI